jgi:uncharacterized protein with PIN domain
MGNKIKFHLDENVSYNIALGLRQRGLDENLLGVSDEIQLQFALANGRVIFTQDTDFLRINQSSITHAGIAYCPQQSKSIGQIIRGLLLIWEILEPEEMYNHIEFI